eukprot:TRINITY_DN9016_c0_g1_i2.p1 TRINITY_DN9016_c0_g1~~TRINITY_DN9016_c0_g1_i2.p1  ORF type:complete len:582 (+),score=125.31 TRINITY_DN9016_c0_g1_i2:121-1746(+)
MDELALMPHPSASSDAGALEYAGGPIAEHNFARNRILAFDRTLDQLRRDARQQHEIVANLNEGMKSMISEADLRRALGLSFEEIESRLEDVFQDSNRRCLAMFARREDLVELQNLIGKKVNWAEHHSVLERLTELKQYIDVMSESVFVGHQNALNAEFGKKADISVVEQALKSKADFGDVSEVRARLERLESLLESAETRHSKSLDDLRAEMEEHGCQHAARQEEVVKANRAAVLSLEESLAATSARLKAVESEVKLASQQRSKMAEMEKMLRTRQESVLASISALQDRMQGHDEEAVKVNEALNSIGNELQDMRDESDKSIRGINDQLSGCKDKIDFLMQASEALKRKSKELSKNTLARIEDICKDQEKHTTQIVSLERTVKKSDKDLRSLEHRFSSAENDRNGAVGGFRALMPPAPDELSGGPAVDAPTERLKGVLESLERIANGGHPFEHMGVEVNPGRPPLPFAVGDKMRGISMDLTSLPRFVGLEAPAAIDSARGPAGIPPAPASTTTVRSMYGLSPRPAPVPPAGATGKSPRKRK